MPKIAEIPKKHVQEKSEVIGCNVGDILNTESREKWNLGRLLGYLAARTQQGMALLNDFLLLIIFLIFPSC